MNVRWLASGGTKLYITIRPFLLTEWVVYNGVVGFKAKMTLYQLWYGNDFIVLRLCGPSHYSSWSYCIIIGSHMKMNVAQE